MIFLFCIIQNTEANPFKVHNNYDIINQMIRRYITIY